MSAMSMHNSDNAFSEQDVVISCTKEIMQNIQKNIKYSKLIEENITMKYYYINKVMKTSFEKYPSLTTDYSSNLQKVMAKILS